MLNMKHFKTIQKKIARHSLLIITLSSLLFAIGSVAVTKSLPPKYQAAVSYTIDHRNLQKSEDYAFDGYYALRAQEIFADTLVSWFKTPAVIEQVKELAANHVDSKIPPRLEYRVKKFSGQNIVVTLIDSDKERLRVLASTTTGVITSRAGELNRQGEDGESLFSVTASRPFIFPKVFSLAQAAIIGLMLGAVISSLFVFLITPSKK